MSVKIQRLQQIIKEKVARVLMRDVSDPRIGIVTITKVKLATDLSECAIYYSVLGDDGARSRCQHALNDARGFVQREVAGALRTRTTPHVVFAFDPSIEGSVRISRMIDEALADSRPAPPDDADDEPQDEA